MTRCKRQKRGRGEPTGHYRNRSEIGKSEPQSLHSGACGGPPIAFKSICRASTIGSYNGDIFRAAPAAGHVTAAAVRSFDPRTRHYSVLLTLILDATLTIATMKGAGYEKSSRRCYYCSVATSVRSVRGASGVTGIDSIAIPAGPPPHRTSFTSHCLSNSTVRL
jgi:hypothetical protein